MDSSSSPVRRNWRQKDLQHKHCFHLHWSHQSKHKILPISILLWCHHVSAFCPCHLKKTSIKGLKTRVGRKTKISMKMKELGVNLTLLVGRWLKWWGSPSGVLIKHICLLCIVQLRPSWYHLQLLSDRHRGQICWCPSRHRVRVHWQGRNGALGNRFQPKRVERWHTAH